MRVAQMGDLHLGANYNPPSKFDDINTILIWTADKLIEEKVDLCLVCGDLYKDAKIMFDRGTDETICIGNWLRKLSSAGIEVIVISGTPSHDSIAGYKILKEMNIPDVFIYTQPFLGVPTDGSVSVSVLPGLNRSALMNHDEYKGLPPEQVHRLMTDKITQLCQGMSAQMPDDKPKILMAHMTYQNADTGFADLLMQQEPILTKDAVAGFDLVCLGHIHRPQQIDGKVFYSGPVERLSFNEEGVTPGFYIHEVWPENELVDEDYIASHKLLISHQFIETPARPYLSLDLDEEQIKTAISYLGENPVWLFGTQIKDAIVRLRYSCSEEVAKQLDRKALEKALYDAGAFYVAEIKPNIERTDRARDTRVTESLGPIDALNYWAAEQGLEYEEAQALTVMAMGLLEGVS